MRLSEDDEVPKAVVVLRCCVRISVHGFHSPLRGQFHQRHINAYLLLLNNKNNKNNKNNNNIIIIIIVRV